MSERISEFLQDIGAVCKRHKIRLDIDAIQAMMVVEPIECFDAMTTTRYYCDIGTGGYVEAESEEAAKRKAAQMLVCALATGHAQFSAYPDFDGGNDEAIDEVIGVTT